MERVGRPRAWWRAGRPRPYDVGVWRVGRPSPTMGCVWAGGENQPLRCEGCDGRGEREYGGGRGDPAPTSGDVGRAGRPRPYDVVSGASRETARIVAGGQGDPAPTIFGVIFSKLTLIVWLGNR